MAQPNVTVLLTYLLSCCWPTLFSVAIQVGHQEEYPAFCGPRVTVMNTLIRKVSLVATTVMI